MTVTLEPQQDPGQLPFRRPSPVRPDLREQFRGVKSVVLTVGGVILAAVAAIVVAVIFFAPTSRTKVTAIDYGLRMPVTMKAGTEELRLVNAGAQGHELLVFRTSLRANALPVDNEGNVVEDDPQLHKVLDSGDALAPNKSQLLTVRLAPGHYVALCNLPGHYRAGMRLDLQVTK